MENLKILSMEDQRYYQNDIKNKIDGMDFISVKELKITANLKQAIAYLNKEEFDLVLIDLIIRDRADGFDLVKYCTKNRIPAIVYTGETSNEYHTRANGLGCFNIQLKKTPDGLQNGIKGILPEIAKRRAERFYDKFYTSDKNIRILVENFYIGIYTGPIFIGSRMFGDAMSFLESLFETIELDYYELDLSRSIDSNAKRFLAKATAAVEENTYVVATNAEKICREASDFLDAIRNQSNLRLILPVPASAYDIPRVVSQGKALERVLSSGQFVNLSPLSERIEDLTYTFKKIFPEIECDPKLTIILKEKAEGVSQNEFIDYCRVLKSKFAKKKKITISDILEATDSATIKGFDKDEYMDTILTEQALNVGLSEVLKEIKDRIFIHQYKKNGQHLSKTCEDLKISKSLGLSAIERFRDKLI